MIELRDGWDNLICYSQEQFNSLRADKEFPLAQEAAYSVLAFFVANPSYVKLLHRWRELSGQNGRNLTLLDAHGLINVPGWSYQDNREAIPVQDWIDRHDGSATALAIFACNPNNADITARRSLVFHPNQNVSLEDVMFRRDIARVYVPTKGYIGRGGREIQRVIQSL